MLGQTNAEDVGADKRRMACEYEITGRTFELPVPKQFVISQLAELVGGLRK
jgi:hypothetical protein